MRTAFSNLLRAAVPAALVFAALAGWMHLQQSALIASAQAAARVNELHPSRPLAEVVSAVAAMKLVTVEIDTVMKIERGDESWRGDVLASIQVPVRLSYGTDLSKMDVSSLAYSPLTGAYVVRVPRPTRIATQQGTEETPPEVKTGWLRLRSQAGEYYLSMARKDSPKAAEELRLLPEDAERVESTTREQVEKLVKAIVGPRAGVVVTFQDDGAP